MRKYLVPVLLIIVTAQTVFLVTQMPQLKGFGSASFWAEWWRVGQVMRMVQAHHVDGEEMRFSDLADGAIRGMVSGADRHSSYLDAESYKDFKTQADQVYAGIGVEVRPVEEGLIVSAVFPNSPAERKKLAPGDRIVAVEGELIAGEPVEQVITRIRGVPGTSVGLRIVRPLSDEAMEVEITREEISFPSLTSLGEVAEGIHLVRIRQFGQRTVEELEAWLAGIDPAEARGLVFDVRNNPGGLLTAAIDSVDLFIPRGEVILSTERPVNGSSYFHRAYRDPLIEGVPIVVLQNRFSASASEIFAGALQAASLAAVVGESSFGKGSVQSVIPMRRGDAVSLTTLRYRLSDGSFVEEGGINPDLEVEVDDETVIRLAIQGAYAEVLDEDSFKESFGFEPIEDVVLSRAVEWLQSADKWPPESSQPQTEPPDDSGG